MIQPAALCAEQASQSRGCLSDRTLGRWVDAHLYPPAAATDADVDADADADEAGGESEGEAAAGAARRGGGTGLVGQLLRTRIASEDEGSVSAADQFDQAVGSVIEDQFRKALEDYARGQGAEGADVQKAGQGAVLGADVRGPPVVRTRAPEYALSEQFLHKARR